MYTNQGARFRKSLLGFMLVTVLLSLFQPSGVTIAQEAGILQTADQLYVRVPPLPGEFIQEHIINGPPVPPPGFGEERQPAEVFASSAVTLEGVPAYTWSLGCSAGGGGMTAAYLDKQYTNLIDGEMPLDDTSMPEYMDNSGAKYKVNPAMSSLEIFEQYWVEYASPLPDPFTQCSSPSLLPIGDNLSDQAVCTLEHDWKVLGDFMYTSQSTFGNIDGSTKFYTYSNSAVPFTGEEMSSNSKPDGTLGIKLYYETRGYAVGDVYNQLTSNVVSGGFSLAQYKAEINAGRPVMLHLGGQSEDEPGHTVVGIGYDTSSSTIYIHDGWDYATHTMTWGGSYSGMPLQMVSIVTIVPGTPSKYTITGNVGVANAIIKYTGGNTTSDANGNYSFEVVSGWFGNVKPSKTGVTFTPATRSFANVTSNVVAQNFNGVNLLQDPSFESGASNNAYWDGMSTNFGTPLCTAQECGITDSLARTGQIWAWFGGVDAPQEIATLSQTVTIPSASSASLDFYLWINDARTGSDANDVFRVKVDGTMVFTTNATQLKYYVDDYRPINVNLSAYADGSAHEIEFSAVTTQQVVSFHLDDVSLTSTPISRTISGNAGVDGAILSYVDGTTKTVTADGSGNYGIIVSNGWSGTVTPYKSGYIFTPASKSYNNVQSNQISQNYTAQACASCSDIELVIGDNWKGSYVLPQNTALQTTYANTSDGPVQVTNTTNNNAIASQRVLAVGKSYSELMGFPNNQLTNEYIFPYYNNIVMDSQLRVSNLGGTDTTIKVYLGSNPIPIDSYILGAGQANRKNYAATEGGPLRITSDTTNILTTLRAWVNNASFSELTGYPANQLKKEYVFPYYNNIDLDSQLRISNLGTETTTIKVYLGSNPNPIDSYTLAAGAATRKNYVGKRDGPLRVTSTTTNILSTIRAYIVGGSFSELMGFPSDNIADMYEYWYPMYDNVHLDSQLRVSNIGTGDTTITVYLGSNPTPIDSYTLAAGAATRKNYAGKNEGPLHVISSAEPILTTIRLWYTAGGFPSYYEVTGYPNNQLTDQYWFPWYNSIVLDTEMRFAAP